MFKKKEKKKKDHWENSTGFVGLRTSLPKPSTDVDGFLKRIKTTIQSTVECGEPGIYIPKRGENYRKIANLNHETAFERKITPSEFIRM